MTARTSLADCPRAELAATAERSCGRPPSGVRGIRRGAQHAAPEEAADFEVAEQEGSFVESLPAEPVRDFFVALAGVAGATGGNDVVEGVAPATGDRQDTVALQRSVGRTAVRAPGPRVLQRSPLAVGEVVNHALQSTLAAQVRAGLATPSHSHPRRLRLHRRLMAEAHRRGTRRSVPAPPTPAAQMRMAPTRATMDRWKHSRG